jgi:hypothetical protein
MFYSSAGFDDFAVAAVPEPSTAAMLGLMLVALAARRSRAGSHWADTAVA